MSRKSSLVASLLLATLFSASASEIPLDSAGNVIDPTLVENQNIAKAQAVGAITSFMKDGTKTCDDDGQNCRSLFGNDDNMDYTSMQGAAKSLTGVDSFSFESEGDSNAVASQVGDLAVACGPDMTAVEKTVSGVAVRVVNCLVNSNGDTRAQVQICTAPSRGNVIKNPENAVECGKDPAGANYRAPEGYTCSKPACETEPLDSLNGWSTPVDITWSASKASTGSDEEKSKNGLGLVFYPPLNGKVVSISQDSDNMTAMKIVSSYMDNTTKATAMGMRIAYRYKATVTKEMLTAGSAAISNPNEVSADWATVEKLQADPMIPQLQQQYGANGSECLQQIVSGVAGDGKVFVCDQTYTNEAGIKPIALSAQVAAEGQECSTVPQCLKEVINTNTWTEVCMADVPLAMRKCSTTQDYTMEKVSYTRTRTTEICHEDRLSAEYSCQTTSEVGGFSANQCPAGAVLVDTFGPNTCWDCTDSYQYFKVTCAGGDRIHLYWWTATPSGALHSPVVDMTVEASPFATGEVTLPPFCANKTGNTFYSTQCDSDQCKYTVWVTGFCPGGEMEFSATAIAPISKEPIYVTTNACTAYENAQ
ncbi:hypothetical protein [Comamonas thiooxydans]|uniref:hypothetical protein n=1 Tax=Comamonas thiooxydans TaxID=363952 RepID=UPI00118729C8|nr:hypothetical protein [Comamonas thiooxydans]